MTSIDVRTLPVGQLTPAEYNPRKLLGPTDKAYRKLRRSIERFGLVEPLVWNEHTGRVVGGHLRLQILKELGVQEVPVSVVQLTDAEERALNVVLNNREAQGRYDADKLTVLLEELKPLPELADTGFSLETLRLLTYQPDETLAPAEEIDRVEVVLVMSGKRFDEVSGRLNAVVAELDVECHIRRG
jgi:ParB-like chromosome segregation protein Spo0J